MRPAHAASCPLAASRHVAARHDPACSPPAVTAPASRQEVDGWRASMLAGGADGRCGSQHVSHTGPGLQLRPGGCKNLCRQAPLGRAVFRAETSMKVKCPVFRASSCRVASADVLACRVSRGPWQPCRWTCMCRSTLQARSKSRLAGILEDSMGNVDAALKQYNAERLPDVLALVNLNQMWSARIGMRTEVSSCMLIPSRPMSWVRLKAA